MQTECVRCHKVMDTVQGYKFSPTEYVCMSCYDEFKAERAAKLKKQHKNPLLDRYGTEGVPPAASPSEPPTSQIAPAQTDAPQVSPPPVAAQPPQQSPPPVASQPAQPQQMFAPKTPAPAQDAPPIGTLKNAAPEKAPTADMCDVCRKPIPDFKVPLKGGKKVCMGCNDVLREVAKSLVLNVKCPQCGHDFQVADD